jgi:predicted dehydrogenase
MTEQIGVGLCSAGTIMRDAHAPAVANGPRTRLVGVQDVVVEAAETIATKHGAKTYARLEELLEDDAVDLVVIAAPNDLRLDQIRACAAAGKHILSEKPLATSYSDANEIVRTCRDAGVLLRVGFQQRYLNQVQLARRAIAEGIIGEVRAFNSVFSAKWDNFYGADNFRWDMRRSGGATMNDNLIHRFDMVRYLLGDEYAAVVADVSHSVIPPKVDDNVHLIVRMQGGARGTMAANRFSPVLSDMTEIYGTEGSIYLWTNVTSPFSTVPFALNTSRDRAALPEWLVGAAFPPARSIARMAMWDGWVSIWPERNDIAAYGQQMAAVANEIAGGDHDRICATGEDGMRATELVQACYTSQVAGHWVEMPLPANAEAVFPDFG